MKTLPLDTMHRMHDALSYDLHKALCGKLEADPELIGKLAERNRWFMQKGYLEDSMPYFLGWEKAISQGVEAVIDLALAKTEYGQVMRSCSPFVALADQGWRLEFLKEWRRKHDAYEKICGHELFRS